MSIYDITYTTQVKRITPPDKRKIKMLAWLNALTNPVQWCRDLLFDAYAKGSSAALWQDIAYSKGDRVVYNTAVYENISAVTISSGILPTDTIHWFKILDTFVGINERVRYNAQKILFEYALNKYFRVTVTPFIYIQNNAIKSKNFILYTTEPNASVLVTTPSAASTFLYPTFTLTPQFNFTIYVPTALWTTLGSSDTIRDAVVRAQADKYNVYGMIYNILPY